MGSEGMSSRMGTGEGRMGDSRQFASRRTIRDAKIAYEGKVKELRASRFVSADCKGLAVLEISSHNGIGWFGECMSENSRQMIAHQDYFVKYITIWY